MEGGARRTIRVGRAVAAAAWVVIAVTILAGSPDERPSSAEVAGEERSRSAPTTTTDPDSRTLSGFNHYRATPTVPMVTVFATPDEGGTVVIRLPRVAELGTPQTFLIERELRDSSGAVWYEVLLPTPPNGSTGWIRAQDVVVEGLDRRIEVRLSEFALFVYDGDELVREYEIGVGTVDTPTPGGDYYVKEAYELTRDTSAYGSHALGINGYSAVLDDWRGGGVIGIHGTNRPDSIGTEASHGCIRLRNEDIGELFELAPRGTPVAILA